VFAGIRTLLNGSLPMRGDPRRIAQSLKLRQWQRIRWVDFGFEGGLSQMAWRMLSR